ncbi:MAG TPA: isopentenyl-diphosphate delta-isomerase [Candidatus Thalassarchaeaceae archaeon]|nr:isopentenyl-diphosphate delta-isomerase [Candidatus Thalassarchaeaceae archaeon]DAC48402.1 MAG TPA: isopentenyl-diphosphate delta-isomerase [Candidatus Poseidoniales archaeon]HIH83685.1 isopentenyl-diphosphate delta-isomerase [Candidatus Thalassarchaeaceae archaeon]|tara:strand:- start:4443 stop:6134 length:1692 start_codon:yes stop_codon:yes gene_type:complete
MSEGGSAVLGDEYDPLQTQMMDEQVILVDEQDLQIGSMSKIESHLGEGALHRAFSVLLFNSVGELLIQKRASSKITFPSVWANSCCSHPLNVEGETEMEGDLGVKRAAIRKLSQELGINETEIPLQQFQLISKMHYLARADSKWVEHELDHIIFIKSDVNLNINPNEIEEVRWVNQEQLDELVCNSPNNGQIIAPWFKEIKRLFLDSWWGHLDEMETFQDGLVHHIGEVGEREDIALLNTLKVHSTEVENRIVRALDKSKHDRLRNAMMHLIEGGGKRLRAILPWLVADACGNSSDSLYDLGAAIEIIHNFTLVHDDIMDNDELRRGRPAVHIAYDMPTAINAGDAMLAVSFEILSESSDISNEHFRSLVSIIGKMVRRVSEGQQLDMDFENRDHVSEEEYLKMTSGKTAAMFTTCSRTGALLSGASEDVIDNLAQWGENLGLCFQLMDDLIDATGDSETLGKPACSDVVEGKQTLIAIHALQQDPSNLQKFHQVFGSGDESISREALDEVLNELLEAGSIDYARMRAMDFHKKAHSCLDSLPESDAVSILRQLTDWQLVRIS